MRCSQCRKVTPSGAKFCPQCGVQLALICRDCGTANSRARKLCTKCRRPLKMSASGRSPGQGGAAVEVARLSKELLARNRDLTESLEQQTATSEILRVISSSPTDPQPVFDMIARWAVRLCDGQFCAVFRFDGEIVHLAALDGMTPEGAEAYRRAIPPRPGPGSAIGRAIANRAAAHIPDVQADPDYAYLTLAHTVTFRSIVAVPMLRDGSPIGGIAVSRSQAGPFSERRLALLQIFADQAVIAIENVRLFQELQARNRDLSEALGQQTVTSEFLKVISRSAFNLEPVLNTLIENATRLCGAEQGYVFRWDGELLRQVVAYNVPPAMRDFLERNPRPPERGTASGRAALERRTVHIPDVLADPEYDREIQRVGGVRTVLAVPMLREDVLIGVTVIRTAEVRPFTDKQIELVTTFADQAVIAIENVRLFQELQARNRDLTEALEQQTATADILEAIISSSPTDIQQVLDTVAKNAARVCDAVDAVILRSEGDILRVAAHYGSIPAIGLGGSIPVDRHTVSGRAIVDRQTVHVRDLASAPDFPTGRALAEQTGGTGQLWLLP